jgi:probable HAF family extracellular repeat protein
VTRPSARRLTLLAVGLAVGWGCSSDSPLEPSLQPELSSATAATYKVVDLGTLGGTRSQAFAINNANVVVGYSGLALYPDTRSHAFVWKNGRMTDLGTLLGGRKSQATAINQDGTIVGWSQNRAGYMRAVRWKNGFRRNLGTLGGRNSQATAINVFGVIVGWSETASGNRHAFKWENGVMTDLGTLGGATSGASGINRGGAIVGQSTTASGEAHAFKWKNGVFTDLGSPGARYSTATAVNTLGQIVGVLGPLPDAVGGELEYTSGFLWHRDVMTPLSSHRRPTNQAEDISPTGIIVGWNYDSRAEGENGDALVWENETVAPLPKLAPGGGSQASGINLAGNIVGYGPTSSGEFHAVLWRRQ